MPLAPSLLLLALSGAAFAGPSGEIIAPSTHPGQAFKISLGLRAGPSFLLGGQGAAWGAALGLGALVDIPLSEETAVSVEFDHANHNMKNAQPLFTGFPGPVDPESVTGTQRLYGFDAGFKMGMLFVDETRMRPSQVTALPWFRMAAGLVFTDTLIDMPTLEGVQTLRSKRPLFTLDPGLGVTVRIKQRFSVQPACKGVMLLGLDHHEAENSDTVRLEWHLRPSLDFFVNF